MLKKSIPVILLIVFANFIVVPTIITLVDDTTDVSWVLSLNEKENKEKESEKDVEIKFLQIENPYDSFIVFSLETVRGYKENCTKHYLKLHLPPPEFS